MRRPALFNLALLLALASGCATYRTDLERARAHYDKSEFDAALALFRVLEPDIDSLSTGEYAQYAYSRGMTDYRLAGLAAPGTAVADPKASFRANARHWLAVARAIEKETPGGISTEEKQRLDEALADLNKDVFGGAESAPDAKGDAAKADAKPDPKGDKGDAAKTDAAKKK